MTLRITPLSLLLGAESRIYTLVDFYQCEDGDDAVFLTSKEMTKHLKEWGKEYVHYRLETLGKTRENLIPDGTD